MKNKTLSLACLAIGISLFTAYSSNTDIVGTWTQPIPGMEGSEQGFVLENEGKASSVNMATLQYETWQRNGSTLILCGKSIGNGQTISFADTLTIEKLTPDSLTLKKGDLMLSYAKKKQ